MARQWVVDAMSMWRATRAFQNTQELFLTPNSRGDINIKVASFFLTEALTPVWCTLRCNKSGALALRYEGAEKRTAALYRCKISGDSDFSHQIWSPLTLDLLLLCLKI